MFAACSPRVKDLIPWLWYQIDQQTAFKAACFIELDLECLCDYFGGSWSTSILETAIIDAMTFSMIILVFLLKIGMV